MSIFKSSIINIISKVAQSILTVISSVVLARLINPEAFGTYTIILSFYALLAGFVDVGLSASFIKSKKVNQEIKNLFFTINILLGTIVFIFFILSAPLVSSFYKNFDILKLMISFSFTILITSFGLQGLAELTRKKAFKKIMIIDTITNICFVISSIFLAVMNFGVWTFIISAVARSIIHTGLIFYFNKNKYEFSNFGLIKKYSENINFGKQVFYGRMLSGVFNSIDKLFLGITVNSNSLGQYRTPQQHSRMIDTYLRVPFGEVVYSYVERFKNESKESTYYKFGISIMILTMMIYGLLFLEGEKVYLLVFGDNWSEASKYIKYFSLFSMGITLKGVLNTIAMSQNILKKQNQLTAISIFLSIVVLLLYYYIEFSLFFLVQLLSFTIFIYWSSVFLLKFKLISIKNYVSYYYAGSIIIVVFCEVLNRLNFINNSLLISIIFEILMSLVLFHFIKVEMKVSFKQLLK